MKKLVRIVLPILAVVVLAGCGDKLIYEKLSFIINVGLDSAADGKALVTYTSPVVSQSNGSSNKGQENGEAQIEVNTSEANLLKEASENVNQTSPRKLVGGKIQNVLIGNSIAEKGIHDYLEIFERDVRNPMQAWVIIVDGNANEFINKGQKYEGKPYLGLYINQLIDDNSNGGYCPRTTVMDYNTAESIPGLDPILPIMTAEENGVRITGTALINGDKIAGEIDTQETACLMILMGKERNSILSFYTPEELSGTKKKIAVNIRTVKVKSSIDFTDGLPEVKFDIKLSLGLEEYTFDNMESSQKKDAVSDFLQREIKGCMEDVLKKLLEANCDALGIGDRIRATYNHYWKSIGEEDGWRKIYPTLTSDINVKANVDRYGRIE